MTAFTPEPLFRDLTDDEMAATAAKVRADAASGRFGPTAQRLAREELAVLADIAAIESPDVQITVKPTDCPNCGQPASSGHHASENLDACPKWVEGKGWIPRDTAPCSDCGQLVDYISEPWYAIDSGGLCVPCGKARGLSDDEYLMA